MSLGLVIISLLVSVFIGGLTVSYLKKSKNDYLIKLLLAFSGGFLLSIAFIHFIPELYSESSLNIGLFILIGFLIQLILEFFSGGIEHGHVHAHAGAKVPIGLIIALSIHSLIEGIPLGGLLSGTEISSMHQHHGDDSLLLGILFHRIPVAIALMTLLHNSGLKATKTWLILGIFAFMAPIGVLIGINSSSLLSAIDLDIVLAIVVGMFLHISTTIIFETSENHKFNFVKLLLIISGFALAFLIH